MNEKSRKSQAESRLNSEQMQLQTSSIRKIT